MKLYEQIAQIVLARWAEEERARAVIDALGPERHFQLTRDLTACGLSMYDPGLHFTRRPEKVTCLACTVEDK